jgi:tRNA threonylcarbamoyladenosine biosynthesis protein TsaE
MAAPVSHLVRSYSEADTRRLAEALAPGLRPGDTLLLSGPIGAGKTLFARALIQARLARLGRVEDVPSPTFTLVQTYDDGQTEIWHADLYRLSLADEVLELGLEDAFGSSICLVEWPDRLGAAAPTDALTLTFRATEDASTREIRFSGPAAWGDRLSDLLAELADG